MKYAIGMAMLLSAAAANAQAARPAAEYFPAPALNGRPAPFSSAVRVGDVLYLSGAIGVTPDGKLPETFEGQAKQTMENVGAALKAKCPAASGHLSDFRPPRFEPRGCGRRSWC